MTLFAQADSEADDCLIVGPEKSNITRAAEAIRFRITSARYTEPTEDSDGMQRAVWAAATSGDTDAIKSVLAIMVRRARLFGLDMPAKVTSLRSRP